MVNGESGQTEEWTVEGKGFYSHQMVKGAELALYPARRVYSKDLEKYPKGYYLVKKEILRLCGIQRILWIITRFQRLPGG